MSPQTEKFEERITALLAKANDPAATPEEAETYSKKAEELMVKWGISDAMLDAKRRGQRKAGEKIIEKRVRLHGSFVRAEVALGFAAGRGLGNVRVLKSNGNRSEGTMVQYVWFIGYESDVARAITLFESLQLQAVSARQHWWRTFDEKSRMTNNEQYLAKRQFISSFAWTVEQRLTAMRTTAVEEASQDKSTALVLVDRTAKVDEFIDANYKVRQGRGINGGSWAASSAGRAAGAKANLGGTQVGTGSAGSIGS